MQEDLEKLAEASINDKLSSLSRELGHALHEACRQGLVKEAQALIHCNADVNVVSRLSALKQNESYLFANI